MPSSEIPDRGAVLAASDDIPGRRAELAAGARSDLLIYIGVALATTISLFVLHKWYGTYLDVRYHEDLQQGRPAEALLAAREEDEKLLRAGKVPLPQAIDTLARKGRSPSITPVPSDDLSAVSGWIHARGFKPATAHPVRVPKPAAAPAETPQTPAAVPAPVPGSDAGAGARPLRLKTEVVKPQVTR